jgi:hypothetical protein
VQALARDLWSWAARHPEWHPRGAFGTEVRSFALREADATILIDPLVPADGEALLAALDRIVAGPVAILITIPYHVRSAELLWRRYRSLVEVSIRGHPAVAKRLSGDVPLTPIGDAAALPYGVSAHAIGSPRRYEQPLYVPSQRALAFGDAIVEAGGELRVWSQQPITAERRAWYERRFLPTLAPLLELEVERVLVTHGRPVLTGGRHALAAALAAPPWYHPPT